MILQSKMNLKNSGTYNEARTFLRSLPLDAWIKFEWIPQNISYQVCDLLDEGFYPTIQSVIDETFEWFFITRRVITEELEFHLKRTFEPTLPKESKFNKGSSKLVVDQETNIVYTSAADIVKLKLINHNYQYLSTMLSGNRPNKTKFKYLNS